jgi:GH25 family lysozyme M1 (1,4-beta-N-acetylmuramidase)
MKVLDFSEYQSNPDWDAVVEAGVEGMILKLGETISGEPELDTKFVEHVNNAVAHNLKYGIYFVSHAHNHEDAVAEAQWVNDRVYEYLNGQEPELGTWLDVEVESMKNGDTHQVVMDCIDHLKECGFSYVGIYSGYSFFNSYFNLEDLKERCIPLWVANYSDHNYLEEENPDLNIAAWQYTDHFPVGELCVDADIFY